MHGRGHGKIAGPGRPSSPPIPDELQPSDYYSSFETETGSRAATPDLVIAYSSGSSSTSSSFGELEFPLISSSFGQLEDPSTSSCKLEDRPLIFPDLTTEELEPADPLGLSTMKEVDGGESAYYQSTAWKWDGSPMPRADQPPTWSSF
ncbi:hypothetical protein BDZ89DRAFT_398332 [Hymenopellis radicata]|nr:hypothetical protein BDZ89DRAFT_398332 [Hymenopellis radicata]